MREQWRIRSEGPNENDKVRAGRLAGRQFGRLRAGQLVRLGVARATIVDWVKAGYLHPRLPGVYAVGHTAPSAEGDLSEALLYVGAGAMLSHATALWWFGLIEKRPYVTDVSTARRRRSVGRVLVHERRQLERTFHNGLPITTASQALLDYAATATLNDLRYVLAEAEYHGLLDLDEIEALLGRGKRGSPKLRGAMGRHEPRLAHTRSKYERELLYLCETAGISLPEFNVRSVG